MGQPPHLAHVLVPGADKLGGGRNRAHTGVSTAASAGEFAQQLPDLPMCGWHDSRMEAHFTQRS
jgi:hypothetical protein